MITGIENTQKAICIYDSQSVATDRCVTLKNEF